jgi:beta-lactamase regulating signal transducer with metallopeptidase domain
MITYLIKMILCSGLLLAAYHLLLEKEKMHRFNRFYLLAAVVFSFVIPLISIRVGTITVTDNPYPVVIEAGPSPVANDTPFITPDQNTAVEPQSPIDIIPLALLAIYCLVTVALLFRFIRTITRLWTKASNTLGIRYKNAKLVLLKEKTATHTFLNTIFVSHNDYNGNRVSEEILTHEWTHVKEKHSLDVLFIELVKSIVWFNPVFILYKRAIQLNHEFLADDAVIYTYNDVIAYQHLLLDKINQTNSHNLSSQLNFLITKKRLAMMTQLKNTKRIAIKTILVAVLMTGIFFLFVEKTYGQVRKSEPVKTIPQVINDSASTLTKKPGKDAKIAEIRGWGLNSTDSTPPKMPYMLGPVHGDGVTQEQFDEYEKAVSGVYKMKTAPNGVTYFSADPTGLDIKRLRGIYNNMTKEQQKKATKLIGHIPLYPRPAKKTPTAKEFEAWKNASKYGVWLDGKQIDNKVLDNYKPSDIALYNVSRLYRNAKNYGKYEFEVDLETHASYDKTAKDNSNE